MITMFCVFFFSLRLFPFQGLPQQITIFHFNLFFVSSTLTPTTCMSSFTASINLFFGLPLRLLPGFQVYSIKELTLEPRTQTKILLSWLCSKGERSLKPVTAYSFSDLCDLCGSLSAIAFYQRRSGNVVAVPRIGRKRAVSQFVFTIKGNGQDGHSFLLAQHCCIAL